MEILKKITLTVLFVSIILYAFNGCKKGEDDNFFSFRTRDKRIQGNWLLIKQEKTVEKTYTHGSYTSLIKITEVVEGNILTKSTISTTNSSSGSVNVQTKTEILSLNSQIKFSKDGMYELLSSATPISSTIKSNFDNLCDSFETPGLYCDGYYTYLPYTKSAECTGRWWWQNSKKNKTIVVLNDYLSVYDDYINPVNQELYLSRLTNKEMVTISEQYANDSTYTVNGDSDIEKITSKKISYWEKQK